jgi:hypothetical protein
MGILVVGAVRVVLVPLVNDIPVVVRWRSRVGTNRSGERRSRRSRCGRGGGRSRGNWRSGSDRRHNRCSSSRGRAVEGIEATAGRSRRRLGHTGRGGDGCIGRGLEEGVVGTSRAVGRRLNNSGRRSGSSGRTSLAGSHHFLLFAELSLLFLLETLQPLTTLGNARLPGFLLATKLNLFGVLSGDCPGSWGNRSSNGRLGRSGVTGMRSRRRGSMLGTRGGSRRCRLLQSRLDGRRRGGLGGGSWCFIRATSSSDAGTPSLFTSSLLLVGSLGLLLGLLTFASQTLLNGVVHRRLRR